MPWSYSQRCLFQLRYSHVRLPWQHAPAQTEPLAGQFGHGQMCGCGGAPTGDSCSGKSLWCASNLEAAAVALVEFITRAWKISREAAEAVASTPRRTKREAFIVFCDVNSEDTQHGVVVQEETIDEAIGDQTSGGKEHKVRSEEVRETQIRENAETKGRRRLAP